MLSNLLLRITPFLARQPLRQMSDQVDVPPRLDTEVAEWRVLKAVQPLFAAYVPWGLAAPMDTVVGSGAGKEFFITEMNTIAKSLNDLGVSELEQQSYRNCLEKIEHLLLGLEALVLQRVLDDPDAQEVLAPPIEGTVEDLYESNPRMKRLKDSMKKVFVKFQTRPPDPEAAFAVRRIRPDPPTADATPTVSQYKKLEALGRVVSKREDRLESCTVFLNTQLTPDQFKHLGEKAMKLNRVVNGLPKQLRISESKTWEFHCTNWESQEAANISNRLYHLLSKAICKGHHKVELQLDGFKLDKCCMDKRLAQALLLSCPTDTKRHHCLCTTLVLLTNDHVIISSVCGSARGGEAHILRGIEFGKELWYNIARVSSLAPSTNSQMISLNDLLQDGFFRSGRKGDKFDSNDKAVLVLSLARCLIHLWNGLWMREPWTAESIQFLYDANTVLDRHSPYITCALIDSSRDEAQPIKPTMDDLHLSILGFAQLLVEIETGERIDLNISLPTIRDFKNRIEEAMMPRFNEYGRAHYNCAVENCLEFTTLVMDECKHSQADLLTVARHVLYENIIKPLETNFNLIPDPANAMKRLPLKLQGDTVARMETTSVMGENVSTSIPPKMGMQGEIAPIDTINHHSSQELERSVPNMMFFDEESTLIPQHIDRAEAFFSRFRDFRERHIIPKINDRSRRPRIKIAILDTGVDLGHEDIRGLVDEIKDSRKSQGVYGKDQNPIKSIKSFIGDDGTDRLGHGTHVAGLVLQTAPDADVYIAKVSNDKKFWKMDAIVQAIKWAIHEEVDIINMSFGCYFDVMNVTKAIDCASKAGLKGTILLAAASNNGQNGKRTFPARHGEVIAIHSLDGFGNDIGGMNPSREGYFENFGTLGLGIKTLWHKPPSEPGLLSDIQVMTAEYKSGSSFATPIAAGIVANCIEWIDYMNAEGYLHKTQYSLLRQPKGIRIMLRKQSTKVNDILSIAPWTLWEPDVEEIDNRVLQILLAELNPTV
ncbi:hypothetical protein GGR51DRAFT_524641 [Nemania sp. FL0031]|nr:hypothetical protein GGR51DRAFT_524641 [Nemania sp. FL0031]